MQVLESKGRYDSLYTQDLLRQDAYAFRKLRYGLFYGMIGALAYCLAAWGIDGYNLSRSNAIYPWLKLGLGTWICMILAGLAGLFTVMKDRGQFSVVIWVLTGIIFGWLAGHIPFDGASILLSRFDPDLYNLVDYPFHDGTHARMVFAIVSAVGLFLIGGPFLPALVEISSKASRFLERWVPIVVWVAIFIIAGSLGDGIINRPLRSPVMVMDELIQFKLDHEGTSVDPKEARDIHLSALGSVSDLTGRPRRLILGDYDVALVTVNVLIDFDGVWVRCTVMNDQPGYCRRVE
jgi:hypothetical protein